MIVQDTFHSVENLGDTMKSNVVLYYDYLLFKLT